MPVSEKKKASNAKWNKNNMTTIGCTLKTEEAVLFKLFCKDQGKTPHTVLKEFILECIYGPDEPPTSHTEGP